MTSVSRPEVVVGEGVRARESCGELRRLLVDDPRRTARQALLEECPRPTPLAKLQRTVRATSSKTRSNVPTTQRGTFTNLRAQVSDVAALRRKFSDVDVAPNGRAPGRWAHSGSGRARTESRGGRARPGT